MDWSHSSSQIQGFADIYWQTDAILTGLILKNVSWGRFEPATSFLKQETPIASSFS